MRRVAALTVPILLLALALTGCTTNMPNPAVEWLSNQGGIADASIVIDNTGPWSSSGVVRGELEAGISDAGIRSLVGKIQKFAAGSGGVSFWLGLDERDFVVVDGDNSPSVALWREVLDVPGIVSGIVQPGDVRVRGLRPDAASALAVLWVIDSGVRLEAFTDTATLTADAALDVQYDQVNTAALEFRRPAGCTPEPAVQDFALSLLGRDDIPGATIDLCTGITLDLPADASVASQAVALRTQLDGVGLSNFPVQVTSTVGDATHFASITPGDASLLSVLSVFEQPGVPAMDYSLAPDGTLAVTAYEVPTGDLMALVLGSPAASGFSGIGLEGDPVAILGTPDQLPGLLDEATALDAASDAFGSVQLGQGFGTVFLDAGVGADPDVATAAADLRASGAADRRFFSVRYKSFQVDIVNDVAALTRPDYSDAEIMQDFVDAWNAPAG
ncbi:hypothetical protein BH09ACT4_BH09ACT4_25580 [soil metagenome]